MSLRTKIVLINIVLLVIAVAAATTFTVLQVQDMMLQQAKHEQEARLKVFWSLLHRHGENARIENGNLLINDYIINGNNELPDTIKSIFGGTATIFMGDTRVSTNVQKADGSRAIGTKLTGPAREAIFDQDLSFRGEAMIEGEPYLTAYDPIKNVEQQTIGVLYVGIKKAELFAPFQTLQNRILLVAVAIVVLLAAFGSYVARQALAPLRNLVINLKEIACIGQELTDLSLRLESNSSDEISEVSCEVNNLIDKLHEILTTIKGVGENIVAHSTNMSSSVEMQVSNAAQLSSSVIEISSTMEELSATASQIAEHSRSVVNISQETLKDTRKGVMSVETLTQMMHSISEDSKVNIREIIDLGHKSKEINRVMEIINEIANQTKLIAFNAALEASSAGEAGQRFGVVAAEIRRLADDVVESTGEIEGRITEIMDSVNRLVMSSEKSSRSIQGGLDYSSQTVTTLAQILEGAEQTNDAAKQISLSTQQQQVASSQIVVALRDIESGARSSTQTTDETAAISRDLTGLSDRLNQLLIQFQLLPAQQQKDARVAETETAAETL